MFGFQNYYIITGIIYDGSRSSASPLGTLSVSVLNKNEEKMKWVHVGCPSK